MSHQNYNIGIAVQIGAYSDASQAQPGLRWLFTSGTPGIAGDGTIPDGITAQAELAWENITKILAEAGMGLGDIVKATHWLTRAEDIADYAKVRSKHLGDLRPAAMLAVIPQLVRPGFLVEIEVVAAKG